MKPLGELILYYLSGGSMTPMEVLMAFPDELRITEPLLGDGSQHIVWQMLVKLKRKGLVEVNDRQWVLTEQGEEVRDKCFGGAMTIEGGELAGVKILRADYRRMTCYLRMCGVEVEDKDFVQWLIAHGLLFAAQMLPVLAKQSKKNFREIAQAYLEVWPSESGEQPLEGGGQPSEVG